MKVTKNSSTHDSANRHSKIAVWCTRPLMTEELSPHINEIEEERLLANPAEHKCHVCGMDLILQNHFIPIEELGTGGFGRTFLVYDLLTPGQSIRDKKKRVLKQLCPAQKLTESQFQKIINLFEREAKILDSLKHPQIPGFFNYFSYSPPSSFDRVASLESQQLFYLVQEYIPGQNLYQQLTETNRGFTEERVRDILLQLLPVLKYIHQQNIIHRDIKPHNIICNPNGKLYLIDFGAVKEAVRFVEDDVSASNLLSGNTTMIASPGFAPAEQAQGKKVYPCSDLYSLAATCVSLLTNQFGYELGESLREGTWKQQIRIGPRLVRILDKMLFHSRRNRYQTAKEAIEAIQESSPWQKIFLPVTLAALGGVFIGKYILNPENNSNIIPKANDETVIARNFKSLRQNLDRNSDRIEIADRISLGEKILTSANIPGKQEAVKAFKEGDYQTAITELENYLRIQHNDPEALIFLNNARIGKKKHYTIVASVPIGSDPNGSNEILRGIAQAQNEINTVTGIKGIFLKVGIADDENNPEVAKQIATTLVQNKEILGVVGPYASDVTLAAGNIYDSGQLVAITPISTSVKLSNFSPYIFRTVPSDFMAARTLANYMVTNLHKKKAAVFFNSQSGYSQSLKSEFVSAVSLFGGQVVSEFDLSRSDLSAMKSIEQAIERGAEVLMLAPNTGELDKALQIIQVNQKKLPLLGGDDVYAPKTLEIGAEEALGMVLAVPWHIQGHLQSDFLRQSRQLWGADINWRTAMAYDATKAFIAALKTSPTREGVQKALSAPIFSVEGASEKIRFLPSGDRNASVQLVEIKRGDRSGTGYDFTAISK
jgi:branched-chain amino acid transport system substrate-binding protein